MNGSPKGGYHPVDELRGGMPVSGWYTIRIQAEAKFRHADFDPKKFHFPPGNDPSEPIRLSLFTGTLEGIDPENKEVVDYRGDASAIRRAASRDVGSAGRPARRGSNAASGSIAGTSRGSVFRMARPTPTTGSSHYFRENKYTLLNKEQLAKFEEDAARGDNSNAPMWFESPRIRVSKIEIEGPHNDVVAAGEPSRGFRRAAVSERSGGRGAAAASPRGRGGGRRRRMK